MENEPKLENTFCFYPFSELALKDWPSGHIGVVTPCCNMLNMQVNDPMEIGEDNSDKSIEQLWNHENLKQLRKDMLNGVKNPKCETCWKMEEETGTSYRLHSKQNYIDVDINNPKLQIIDLSTGDSCNLRCQMCSPGTSNRLRIDARYFREHDFDYKWWNKDLPDKIYEPGAENKTFHGPKIESPQWTELKENLGDIKIIKATGGETLASKAFVDLLDHAIETGDSKHISLNFTTNATKFSKPNLARFKHFERLQPTLSIDAVGKTYDYVRWGAKWTDVSNNIEKLITESDNIEQLHVNFVLTSYNVFSILETTEYFYNLKQKYKVPVNMHIDLVFPYGRPIDVQWLPQYLLQQAIKQAEQANAYAGHEFWLLFDKAISYMKQHCKEKENNEKIKAMYAETIMFDASRNRKYNDYLHKEISDYLDEVKANV